MVDFDKIQPPFEVPPGVKHYLIDWLAEVIEIN